MTGDFILTWALMVGIFVSGFQMARALHRSAVARSRSSAVACVAMAILFASLLAMPTGILLYCVGAVSVALFVVSALMSLLESRENQRGKISA